jgi:predicted lipase
MNPLLLSLFGLYNMTQLSIGVWLSGAAYCGKDQYDTMIVSGPAAGFVVKDTLYDPVTDIQGYTGILDNTIYLVLRGSSSVMNWLDDIEVKLEEYTTFPECDCYVHRGFYRSALGIRDAAIQSVTSLLDKYPQYDVIVTGHSYGASTSQLLAMELEKVGINVSIYNYGQPRVGDKKYATFAETIIDNIWRTTHNKDIVPHLPPTVGFGYIHSCQEIFQDTSGDLTLCSPTDCEDTKCANQFSLIHTDSNDHLYYLGHRLSCEESTMNII